MIKIVDIYKLGGACPTQWYGKDEVTGLWLSFHYRFGRLLVDWRSSGKLVFHKRVGKEMDGVMSFEQLKRHLMGEVHFFCEERDPTEEELE